MPESLYDVLIWDNIISSNGHCGIYSLWHNERVSIIGNTILYNEDYGLYLISYEQSVIEDNNISYNTGGIFLYTSYDNVIVDNEINHNEDYAVYFYGYSNSNIIENNMIIDNGLQEFYFRNSGYNIIRYNTIVDSSPYFCYFSGTCTENIIENNTFFHDIYEINDIFDQAKDIIAGIYEDLVAIDEDWYKIYLLRGELCSVSLDFSASYDPLDLSFYNSSATLLRFSNSGGYNRYISYNATSSDYYYIQIFNGFNLNYSLHIEIYQRPEPQKKNIKFG